MPTRNSKHRIKGRIDREVNLSGFTTAQLVKELESREGIMTLEIPNHGDYEIHHPTGSVVETGAAIILVIED